MVIRDLSTSVTLPGLCQPRVRLVNSDHCLARRAVGAGAPSWPRPFRLWGIWARFFCCSVGCSPFWGSHTALHRARGIHPNLALQPRLFLLLLWRPSLSCLPFYPNLTIFHVSKSDFTNHKQDDILIIIHFTKRFTIVHL